MPKNKSIFGEVLGDKELLKTMSGLPAAIEKKVMRPALRAGGKVALARVKLEAPTSRGKSGKRRKSGALKRSLRVKAIKRSRKKIGVRIVSGSEWFRGPTYYAAFVELGYRRGSKKIPGQRFMRRGLYESESLVRTEIRKVAKQKLPIVIAAELARQLKKGQAA